jgi:hypothetical protein
MIEMHTSFGAIGAGGQLMRELRPLATVLGRSL